MTKWTFAEVAAGWEEARQETNRQHGDKALFQELWSKVLAKSGWTREEFHQHLDQHHGSGHEEKEADK